MNKKWKKFIFQLLPRFFLTVALNWLLWSAECQEEDARYSLATIGNIIGNNQEGKRSTESERDWEILLLKNTFFFYSRATVTLTGHDVWTSQRSQPDIHRKSALLPVCSWLSTGRLSGELQSLLNHYRARFSVAPHCLSFLVVCIIQKYLQIPYFIVLSSLHVTLQLWS